MSDSDSSPEAKAAVFTPSTTVDELIKAAFFVATSIDAPVVDAVSTRHLNLHYPADGSLVSIRIESRPGVWGGIQAHSTPEAEAAANEHYDAMLASSLPPEPPPETRGEKEHPVWEVQRQ